MHLFPCVNIDVCRSFNFPLFAESPLTNHITKITHSSRAVKSLDLFTAKLRVLWRGVLCLKLPVKQTFIFLLSSVMCKF